MNTSNYRLYNNAVNIKKPTVFSYFDYRLYATNYTVAPVSIQTNVPSNKDCMKQTPCSAFMNKNKRFYFRQKYINYSLNLNVRFLYM